MKIMERLIDQHPDDGGGESAKGVEFLAGLAAVNPEAAQDLQEFGRLLCAADQNEVRARLQVLDIDGFFSVIGVTKEQAEKLYSDILEAGLIDDPGEFETRHLSRLPTDEEFEAHRAYLDKYFTLR